MERGHVHQRVLHVTTCLTRGLCCVQCASILNKDMPIDVCSVLGNMHRDVTIWQDHLEELLQ